ncbi:hypothetical protein D9613_003713 [Agrocybe pediades]|uniref:Uncharacterized protein n=1 Tax=Agrocybe pediades TaxID=84607 RepID=A0A8H4QJC5_9AGAR|nr:hypothetical protein D9613_003713 [Agrocybe pediades]
MSANPAPAHPIVNPNVYLNYLPPKVADQFEIARDLYLATLGACIWDMLVSLPEDVMLVRSGFRATLVAYFLSRWALFPTNINTLRTIIRATLGHSEEYVTLAPRPVQNSYRSAFSKILARRISDCDALEYGVTVSWVLATAASSFLFFRRVRAIYNDNKYVRHFFFALLLANIGVSILTIPGSHMKPLADTGYCVNAGVQQYVAAAPFSRLVYDSCVFIAISYRFATISGENMTWRILLSRRASSRIVRAILQGGQQYYLMSVCSNILVSSLIVTPSVPPIYQAILVAPDLALTSSMACRVFRNLKITADTVDTAISKVLFEKTNPALGGQSTQMSKSSSGSVLHVHPIPDPLTPDSEMMMPVGPHSKTNSMPSVRRPQAEVGRYSIIKIKSIGASSTSVSSKTGGGNADSPV